MISPWIIMAVLAGAYLLGSIPTGYWLGKFWKGVDVRQHGSGNLGATNVFRVLGVGPGIATLLIDVLKGAAPVIGVKHFLPGMVGLAAVAGLAAILGHTASMFVKFHGGKGVATSAGVFTALLPLPSLAALGGFLLSLVLFRRVSVSSLSAAVILTVTAFVWVEDRRLAYMATGVALLVFWKHRENMKRILAGTEPRIDWKGQV